MVLFCYHSQSLSGLHHKNVVGLLDCVVSADHYDGLEGNTHSIPYERKAQLH